MRIFFLCLCFLSVAGMGQAQRFQSPQWQVRAFHAPEELGYEEVHDLQKARDGSVWLATDGGGVTWLQNGQSTVYNRSQGLISNSCRGVLEDAWGGIWVGTNQGISYINKGTISNFTSKTFAFLQNDAIVSIAIDSQDRIWFANEANQIFYFTPTTLVQNEPQGLWSLYPYSGKPGSRIEALSFNSQGHLWVVLDYGGVELFTKQGEYFHYNVNGNAKLNVPCSAILLTADDSLWICGAGQLRCLADGQLQKRIPTPYSLTALGEYQGTILVGTADHGLFYLEGEQLLPIPLGNDQPLTHIECIRSYGDEVIWIGSHEGAYRISPSPWQMLPDLTPGVLLQPQTLTRTADGSLYILDQKATLYKFDYNGWEKQVTLPIKKEGDEYRFAVHSMIAKQNEALFLLADQECFEISLPPPIVVRPLPLPQDYQAEPHCGLFLSSQSELWLAYTQGIARWNGVRWEPFPLGKEHANPQVFWIHEIEPGWYWFLGSGWIEENRNGVIQSVSLPQTYTDFTDEASKLFCAVNHRNAVWIATDRNGILRFDGSGWQHFHHRDGLPNEGIRSLYSAPDGVLWIGSNHNGVGSFQDGRWIVYRYNEGLPNGVVDRISQDPFGTIWAEIRYEGIACYRPSKRRPVVWMEMESSSLLPGESGVFSFDGRDHWNETEQEDLVFSWRILDRINHRITADWSPYSHARIVNTPRLQPGQYQFQVRVQDTDRRTSLAPVTSDFTVMPYFWSTPAFWVPVLVAIAAIFSSLWIWFRKHRALLHSEEQYRHLVEKDTRTLMVNWDGEGRIIYCNECFEKLVGVPLATLRGTSILPLLANGIPGMVRKFEDTVLKAHKALDVPQECLLGTRIGFSEIWISWFFRMVRAGNRLGMEIHAVGVDITQQVNTEKSLMQEKMSFQNFCESVQIGLIRTDLDGNILYMNPIFQKFVGIQSEGTEGAFLISWRNPAAFKQYLQRICASLKPVSELMDGVRLGTSEPFFLFMSGLKKDKKIEILSLDYTEHKQMERRLAIASSREQERLGRELHDGLGQHLTALAYLGTTMERKARNFDLELAERMTDMNAYIQEAIQLTRDLSKGLYPAYLEQGGLKGALTDLISSYNKTYSTKFHLQIYQNSLPISTHHMIHVYRIVKEACFNALKHANAQNIYITAHTTDTNVIFQVIDDGIGIQPQMVRKFTGLGLNIMEYHAHSVGGTLTVSQTSAGGTAVICQIPISADPTQLTPLDRFPGA